MPGFLAQNTEAGVLVTRAAGNAGPGLLVDRAGACRVLAPAEAATLAHATPPLAAASVLCDAVLGAVPLLDRTAVVLAVATEPVGALCGHTVRRVARTTLLLAEHSSNSGTRSARAPLSDAEARAQRSAAAMLTTLLESHAFFYADGYDLTATVQQQAALLASESSPSLPRAQPGAHKSSENESDGNDSSNETVWRCARPEFCWNYAMAQTLLAAGGGFCVRAIVDGLVSIVRVVVPEQGNSSFPGGISSGSCDSGSTSSINGDGKGEEEGEDEDDTRTLRVAFVSRRACARTGMRFRCRGADLRGNVANYVETEQVVQWGAIVSAFVQIRGSVPLLWEQRVDGFRGTLVLSGDTPRAAAALRAHFAYVRAQYGGPCTVLNLINSTGDEGHLERAFFRALCAYKDEQQQQQKCAGNKHKNEDGDENKDEDKDKKQVYKKPNDKDDDQDDDDEEETRIEYHHFDFHAHCRGNRYDQVLVLLERVRPALGAMQYFLQRCGAAPVLRQRGVVRTNCVDCLDRTNVVQSVVSRAVLAVQLRQLGLVAAGADVDALPALAAHLRTVWADNADYMSTQYTGTNALKTGYTRTGRQSVRGNVMDGMNAMRRVVANQLQYTARELELNFFLGHYRCDRLEDVRRLVARDALPDNPASPVTSPAASVAAAAAGYGSGNSGALSGTATNSFGASSAAGVPAYMPFNAGDRKLFGGVVLIERHTRHTTPVVLEINERRRVLSVDNVQLFLRQDHPFASIAAVEPSLTDPELLRLLVAREPFPLKLRFPSGLALFQFQTILNRCLQQEEQQQQQNGEKGENTSASAATSATTSATTTTTTTPKTDLPESVSIWCGSWDARGCTEPTKVIEGWLEPGHDIYVVGVHNMSAEAAEGRAADGADDWWCRLRRHCGAALGAEQLTAHENAVARVALFARPALRAHVAGVQTSGVRLEPFQLKSGVPRGAALGDSARAAREDARAARDPQCVGAAVAFALGGAAFAVLDVAFDPTNRQHAWAQRCLRTRGGADLADLADTGPHLVLMGRPFAPHEAPDIARCVHGDWCTLVPARVRGPAVLYRAPPRAPGLSEIQPRIVPAPSAASASLDPISVSFRTPIPPPPRTVSSSASSGSTSSSSYDDRIVPRHILTFTDLHAVLQAPDHATDPAVVAGLSTAVVLDARFLARRCATRVCRRSARPRWPEPLEARTLLLDDASLRRQALRVELWSDAGNVVLARGLLPLADIIPAPASSSPAGDTFTTPTATTDSGNNTTLPHRRPSTSAHTVDFAVDLVCSGYVLGQLFGRVTQRRAAAPGLPARGTRGLLLDLDTAIRDDYGADPAPASTPPPVPQRPAPIPPPQPPVLHNVFDTADCTPRDGCIAEEFRRILFDEDAGTATQSEAAGAGDLSPLPPPPTSQPPRPPVSPRNLFDDAVLHTGTTSGCGEHPLQSRGAFDDFF